MKTQFCYKTEGNTAQFSLTTEQQNRTQMYADIGDSHVETSVGMQLKCF